MASRRMKAPDRRRQIMDVAQRLFTRRGYSLTTTAAIAGSAGVTEPILYRHFPSKRELFLRLLEEISAQFLEQLKSLIARSDNPIAQLKAIITNYPELSAKFAEPFAMIDRSLASIGAGRGRGDRSVPDVRPLLADHYHAYEVLVSQIIQQGQQRGQFRGDIDPRVGAWHLIHAAVGWRLCRSLQSEVSQQPDYIEQWADLLLAGLTDGPLK